VVASLVVLGIGKLQLAYSNWLRHTNPPTRAEQKLLCYNWHMQKASLLQNA
jgi:hypothetical protein